ARGRPCRRRAGDGGDGGAGREFAETAAARQAAGKRTPWPRRVVPGHAGRKSRKNSRKAGSAEAAGGQEVRTVSRRERREACASSLLLCDLCVLCERRLDLYVGML